MLTVRTVITLVGTPSPNCSNDCPNCSGDIDQIYIIIFYLVEMVSTIVGTVIDTVRTVTTLVGTPNPNCRNNLTSLVQVVLAPGMFVCLFDAHKFISICTKAQTVTL